MASDFALSRRTLLAGSAMTFVMTLPAGTLAQARGTDLPLLVQVSWGPQEQPDPARLVAGIFAALGPGAGSAWVHAHA